MAYKYIIQYNFYFIIFYDESDTDSLKINFSVKNFNLIIEINLVK